jgi:hypothetical protein
MIDSLVGTINGVESHSRNAERKNRHSSPSSPAGTFPPAASKFSCSGGTRSHFLERQHVIRLPVSFRRRR